MTDLQFLLELNICYPRFEETPEGLDIELASVDKEEIAHSFSNGDMVEVIEGELQNLQGKVTELILLPILLSK